MQVKPETVLPSGHYLSLTLNNNKSKQSTHSDELMYSYSKQNPHIQVSCKQNNSYNRYIDHNSYVLKNSSPSNKSKQLLPKMLTCKINSNLSAKKIAPSMQTASTLSESWGFSRLCMGPNYMLKCILHWMTSE